LQEAFMRIALPVSRNKVAGHFGHPEHFLIFDVDEQGQGPVSRLDPPPHEHGVIPRWLLAQGADVVLAQRMGPGARRLLEEGGATVLTGLPPREPEWLVREFIAGRLRDEPSSCGHQF
jgi:ATP-binding protein involved in chromosome partitioning